MSTLLKKKTIKKVAVKKTPTHFQLRILSRHPSCGKLRHKIFVKGAKVVYRHGSTTQGDFKYEINSTSSIRNSADKLRMKECFDKAKISQAKWRKLEVLKSSNEMSEFIKEVNFPENYLIIKSRFGSRGNGNYLIKTKKELDSFIKSRNCSDYIIEEYKNYSKEFRIHVSKNGCFYTCRKALKKDTPEENKFQRHDDNCVWIIETNPDFGKPSNWSSIVKDCVEALKAIGADVLAFDVKTTDPKNSKEKDKSVKWIIIESCSAPSFGDKTADNYIIELPKIIKTKYNL
jgi:D-alanine-D-alanine ligase-like ATP-grasp enzyme